MIIINSLNTKKTVFQSAFTLIELLVVLSIIAILSSLLLPNVVKIITKGEMTQTLNNGRELVLATTSASLEGESAWPADLQSPSFLSWSKTLLNSSLSSNDLIKLFSAPGVKLASLPTKTESTAFKVFPVSENSPSDTLFLITRNATVHPQAKSQGNGFFITLDPKVKPYGDKGCVLIHRGGDGVILFPQQLTNNPSLGILAEGKDLP